MARKTNQTKQQDVKVAEKAGVNGGVPMAEQEKRLQEAMASMKDGMQMLFAGYAKIFTGLSVLPFGAPFQPVPEKALERPLEQELERRGGQADTETGDSGKKPGAADKKLASPSDNLLDIPNSGGNPTVPFAVESVKADGGNAVTPDVNPVPAAGGNSPVTKDDLLREIQAKFKKDRRNQEKIRRILLAYGASGLSLLDDAKYADFLNDVRQL